MKTALALLPLPFLFLCSCRDEDPSSVQASPDAKSPDSSPIQQSSRKIGNRVTRSDRKANSEQARIESARETISLLVGGIDDFYENYQYLPGSDLRAIDSIVSSDLPLSDNSTEGPTISAVLMGLRSAEKENPKSLNFLPKIKMAKDDMDGVILNENESKLVDPWGNPYFLLLNYDNDNQLRVPLNNEILFDRRILVWSLGPDGQSGTPETDQDNIYSWNQ